MVALSFFTKNFFSAALVFMNICKFVSKLFFLFSKRNSLCVPMYKRNPPVLIWQYGSANSNYMHCARNPTKRSPF